MYSLSRMQSNFKLWNQSQKPVSVSPQNKPASFRRSPSLFSSETEASRAAQNRCSDRYPADLRPVRVRRHHSSVPVLQPRSKARTTNRTNKYTAENTVGELTVRGLPSQMSRILNVSNKSKKHTNTSWLFPLNYQRKHPGEPHEAEWIRFKSQLGWPSLLHSCYWLIQTRKRDHKRPPATTIRSLSKSLKSSHSLFFRIPIHQRQGGLYDIIQQCS